MTGGGGGSVQCLQHRLGTAGIEVGVVYLLQRVSNKALDAIAAVYGGYKYFAAQIFEFFFVKNLVFCIKTEDYTYFYTCGPEPMLKAVWKATKTSGQMSFEERMGCGFGACMGCSCKTLTGYKRICREGPVMRKEEILWEN